MKDGDGLLSIARSKVWSLTPDEEAVFHGMVAATEALGVEPSPFDARAASEVFYAFRFRPCPFCRRGIADHGLDLDRPGVVVRCRADGASRPVPEWLTGPRREPIGRQLGAVALWVGIPVLSLSLLAWLMPVVSAAVFRTRRWIVAAVAWLILSALTLGIVLPSIPVGEGADLGVWDALFGAYWLGGIVWGICHVRPWLAGLPPLQRQYPRAAGVWSGPGPGALRQPQSPLSGSSSPC